MLHSPSAQYLALLFAMIFSVDAQSHRNEECGSGLLREYNAFPRPRTCRPFEEGNDICHKVFGYTATRTPNFLNHHTQREAQRELNNFRELVATECQSDLFFVLCLYHFPLCVSGRVNPVVPCQGLCERVRDKCNPVLQRFNYTWPRRFDCDALPVKTGIVCERMEAEICVSGSSTRNITELEYWQGYQQVAFLPVTMTAGNGKKSTPTLEKNPVESPKTELGGYHNLTLKPGSCDSKYFPTLRT